VDLVRDYRNGNEAFPEVHSLMMDLFGYEEHAYHPELPVGEFVVPLRCWVKNIKNRVSVFPGGNGALGDRFPVGGVMVLLNDFDSLANYLVGVRRGYKGSSGQPPSLMRKMLEATCPGLSSQAWLTNFCLGVRVADGNTGISPGWGYEPYRNLCRDFFERSLMAQRPRLIVALGEHVPRYLASVSLDLTQWGRSDNSFNERGVVKATFRNGFTCHVISNVHSAFRHINVLPRRYKGLSGDAAEMMLLHDGIRAAGLQ